MYVLITTSGKKYLKWNYRLDGKDHTYTLGVFPALGLAEARAKRAEAEKLVLAGIHPADQGKLAVAKTKAEMATTFWMVADEWIKANKVKWTASYAKRVETVMQRYVRDNPIGGRPINHISPTDIYYLVTRVAKRDGCSDSERKASGAPTVAILLRQWCRAVFRLAVISGRAERNPVSDLNAADVIVRPKVRHNRSLARDELENLLLSLYRFSGRRATGIAIELLLLTFVRTQELRCAPWEEFDLNKATWTIPAARMKDKDGGDHVVPLSAQAVTLLLELREICGTPLQGEDWLFPNQRRASDCMTATTINRALERMGYCGKGTIGFTAHGFRGTASTLLHEMGFQEKFIEAQLAHHVRNQVAAAYNKAKYLDDRRVMMQKWADFVDTLRPFDIDLIDSLN